MAAFIDNLAIGLLTIAFAGAIILYMTAGLYCNYRKKSKIDIFRGNPNPNRTPRWRQLPRN